MPERATIFVTREGGALKPRARFDAALLDKFKPGVPLRCELAERRVIGRHRLYWAVLQAVVDATGRWPNVEALHWALKVRLGYIEEITSIDGKPLIRPRSTSFARMGEQDFREYFENALQVITADVCPGMTVEDLLSLGRNRLVHGDME